MPPVRSHAAAAPSGTAAGQKLRDARHRAGLSVNTLATRTGIGFSKLYRVEYYATAQPLTAEEASRVAEVLGVPAEVLA